MENTIFVFLMMIVFYVGVSALIFYILYRVIRAAVRDGIRDARKAEEKKA